MPFDGIDDLGPASVVEGEGQRESAVVSGQCRRFVLASQQPPRHPPVAPAGETDAHSLLVQLSRRRSEDLLVEPHEEAHLVDRPTPVLRREGVDGQPLDAEIERALHGVEQRLLARGMPVGAFEPAPLGPPAVAVHHTADVARYAAQVDAIHERPSTTGRYAWPRMSSAVATLQRLSLRHLDRRW